ncbi:MAG TPA: type II secretion system major pseudopilin GspG [Longimicrobiales bacterium]
MRCRPDRRPAPGPAARCGEASLSPRRCRRAGLTLIEMLVVIVVLSVLATLVAPNVFQHVGSARDATARSQIEMISAALDAYRLDNGRYPTTEQGLAALWEEPLVGPRPTNWRGPYLRKRVPLDPWDRPYIYRSPGEESGMGFDLLSYGADGEAGGTGEDADVKSWE